MKYFLVLNPGSGNGRGRRQFARLKDFLGRQGIQCDAEQTRDLEDARLLSARANALGYDAVVAVGGDGTINGVMNGFFDEKGRRRSTAAMGVFYTGTSPDFCKSYGIPLDFEQALSTLAEPKLVKIRVGKITYAAASPAKPGETETATGYFACCVNVGLGAEVARRANSGIRSWLGDHAGTFASLIGTLASYRASDLAVVKDGRPLVLEKLYNLSVGRTFHIASGIKVCNSVKPEEAGFYCLAVRNLKARDILPCLKAIYSGSPVINRPFISLDYCTTLEIPAQGLGGEVEFDGDTRGFLPCAISTAEDPLNLMVMK